MAADGHDFLKKNDLRFACFFVGNHQRINAMQLRVMALQGFSHSTCTTSPRFHNGHPGVSQPTYSPRILANAFVVTSQRNSGLDLCVNTWVQLCFSWMVFCGGSFSMNIYRYRFNTTFPSSKTTVTAKLYILLKRSWRMITYARTLPWSFPRFGHK